MISNNHATRPKKVYKADRSENIWLTADLDAFRAVASPEMRLALELALWTGQRQGDLLKLGWSSYSEGRISFRHGKRNRKVDMPVPATLRALLDALPHPDEIQWQVLGANPFSAPLAQDHPQCGS